ncbi:hydrogen gas-evolving membrane-bound hydrogenase subunit E [Rhodococcus kroppenstedtii]|uniref:hydrogen gas-evolving membrane-bound hydrogenase subunit E n=1 Tax=Rhodococcoides kroppenstedtii TaxID=293050 RepID=UPI00295350F1|nr:hydrogen gas-evolving membrane-bound hydrogenase subunit E [Rhodococcus kroppenstedtii]MDV7196387.1 hydrogen gas-evolving membrane-bound hydrogenase subunit E [Rhodococcus kroppenstedtii]
MSPTVVLDALLAAGVLVTAVVALWHRDRAASVTVFLGFGVLLTALWARLGAPDVALAEAALAAGVTGALMATVVAGRTRRATPVPRSHRAVDVAEGALAVGIGVALTAVATGAMRSAAPAPTGDAATGALPESVVAHPVTAVLLDFRTYDTMLEIVVLTVAALAAVSTLRDAAPALAVPVDRRPVLTVAVAVLTPVLVVLAAWLLVAGSDRPGGAFQSGAVVTGIVLLTVLTGTVRLPSARTTRLLLAVGSAVFLVVALATALTTGWLTLENPWGGTAVVALEAVLAVSIGVCLAVLALAGSTRA